ncbi:MAG TPA: Fe-S cluster assembly protein NifU [Humidesulfovibrio sp.]|uniref:Fe-S cluster assembly protein NifU n=1 Tax=Humidesulfovibrio sp. TaxID=2910988 RepID=UPI002BACC962|nr:Fe-S cluster assembly protein NifU [Humidesulfovibrio sp.]HWR04140.1 Fe-S cluster assembly protein NifU [Humidesulfovibrio sp.]
MWEYTDIVKEHFLNPKNVGEMKDASCVGEVGSIACGDALKLFLKIEDGIIQDASFQTFGCASAIASSSALTELVKGKTVDEALKISNKDIATALGGLPKEKMHCSVMGQEALEAAIKSWRGEKVTSHEHSEGEIVCECFGVTDQQILSAVRENDLKTIEDVTYYTKAGGGCAKCHEKIGELIAQARGEAKPEPAPAPKKLTNIQRMRMIEEVLEKEIRPRLQLDGGDIELADIEGLVVSVTLRGRCVGCPSSQATVHGVVETILREKVDPEIQVREV